MRHPQLIFIGAPGSGKGTQAKLLKEKYNYRHISTGDILRAEIKKESSLGKRVDDVLKSGKLVDDAMMKELLNSNLDLEGNLYILDGYPRTLVQAKTLKEMLGNRDHKVIFFNVNPDKLIKRLTNRRICQKCGAIYNQLSNPIPKDGQCSCCGSTDIIQRADDREDVISKRITVYLEHVGPVIELYKELGSLVEVNAEQDVAQLASQIGRIVESEEGAE